MWEGPLLGNSLIPDGANVLGSDVGHSNYDFMTWNITPFTADYLSSMPGKLDRTYSYTACNTSPLYLTTTSYQKMLTDFPILINSNRIHALVPSPYWTLCDEYRIAYMNISFSVPELTNNKNNTLYLEWTNLPNAEACTPNDAMFFNVDNVQHDVVSKDPTVVQEHPTPQDISDGHGWNWICRPKDIADATSRTGMRNGNYGWHRAMLTYTHPVTISFRPRHTDIHYDATAVSADYNGKTHYTATPVDQWATNKYLKREYLPILHFESISNENPPKSWAQYWMGPIIRLTDANRMANAEAPRQNMFQEFGIRCSWEIGVHFRGIKDNQIFPQYRNPKLQVPMVGRGSLNFPTSSLNKMITKFNKGVQTVKNAASAIKGVKKLYEYVVPPVWFRVC